MKERLHTLLDRRGARIALAAAGVCFVLAGVFRFALVGYAISALMFAFFGGVILLYLLLPRGLKLLLSVLLVLGVLLFIAAEIPVVRASRGDGAVEADYIIVLGAGVNGAVPSLSMVNRLTAALAYLEAHPDCVAVLTGGMGAGETVTEAEAMAKWLKDRGIPEARLLLEPRATNTAENLSFSFALLPEPERAVVGVVSSEYHLCRAKLMARDLGFTVYGIPAKTTLPLLRINYFIREALGVVHYAVFGA